MTPITPTTEEAPAPTPAPVPEPPRISLEGLDGEFATLATYGNNIHISRSDPVVSKGWYEKVVAGKVGETPVTIKEIVVKEIYGAFYDDLKRADLLWGDKHKNGEWAGHAIDTDWGRKVFLGEIMPPGNVSLVDLNDYRVRAIATVVNGPIPPHENPLSPKS